MLHKIETVQNLPITIHDAWEFLSSPYNLKVITPDSMNFKIISGFKPGEKMYAGMFIEYTVEPIIHIPMHWVTEITQVNEPHYFIDEQRKGPYQIWHHQHFLKEIEGGVEMKDLIYYQLPFWFFGKLLNQILVKKQLQKIFDYRVKKLESLFGKMPDKRI